MPKGLSCFYLLPSYFLHTVCWLNQKNKYGKGQIQTNAVDGKLNFYRGIKGLYHISTNATHLLIIKQGHGPVFTTGRQEAGRAWVMRDNDFYALKPLLTEVSSDHFLKCD